jgi:hypothetical protein
MKRIVFAVALALVCVHAQATAAAGPDAALLQQVPHVPQAPPADGPAAPAPVAPVPAEPAPPPPDPAADAAPAAPPVSEPPAAPPSAQPAAAAVAAADEQADEGMCKAQRSAMDAITTRYAPQFEQLSSDGTAISEDGEKCNGLDLKCEKNDVDWKFDRPTVHMKQQEWSFDIVQVNRKRVEWSYDIVEFRSKIIETGSYPECKKISKPPFIRCTKHVTTASIPEVHTTTKKISFDVPELTWDRTSIKLHVPEVSMTREEWKFNWFVCHVTGLRINAECDDLDERGDALKKKGEQLQASQRNEAVGASLALTSCFRKDLVAKRAAFEAKANEHASAIEKQIDAIRAAGGNPEKLVDGSGATTNLVQSMVEFQQQRIRALEEMDKAIAELDKADAATTQGLLN